MDTLLQDLRYAFRTLARQPAFTAVAILTLAIGIGANTAIYSVVDATLLRTLPFRDPTRLMRVSLIVPSRNGQPVNDDLVWSGPKYEFFRRTQEIYSDSAIYRAMNFNLTGTDNPEQVRSEEVGGTYFQVLGIGPVVGRAFRPEEDTVPNRDFVAVISHGLWERRFGADPQIAGKTIGLDQRTFTIISVLPAGFQGLSGPADVWIPAHAVADVDLTQPQSHSWECVARLKPGVTVEQARSAVTALGPRIDQAISGRASGWGAKARTLAEARIDPAIRKSVLVLFGAVSFVLLIACVNVANLLLARGTVRQREIAIRLAVGANRFRLIRQLLTESVVLSVLGAAASLALAWWGVGVLAAINPVDGNPFGRRISGLTLLGLSSIRLDSSALLFTFAVALVTGILFGLAPAVEGSRADVSGALKNAGARFSVAAAAGKSALVIVEVALAMILLVGAGLMLKSFGRLLGTRSGVDPDNVLTLRISLPNAADEPAAAAAFFTRLQQRVASLPGVVSASLSNCYALGNSCNVTIAMFPDRPPVPRGSEPLIGVPQVSPDYLRTMKIPLLRGRWFTEADRRESPPVVVVNETAAKRFWPGEDPIGKRLALGVSGFSGAGAEVIGVAADVRYQQLDIPSRPDAYVTYLQMPRATTILAVRTTGNPAALTPLVEQELHALNKDLPAWDVKTMNDRVRDSTAPSRFSAILLAVFAFIAMALGAVGIYGVMAYLVTQRTREIGIRVALGAGSRDVLGLVLRRGAALTLVGIAIGVAGALAATRVLTTMLYEVKPADPETYAVIAAMLAIVALAATYIPARRATAVDAATALRAE